MAKRIRRSKSDKKSAVDRQVEQLKKASGGKVSDQLDALINAIRDEEEKEDDFLNVDNLLKELEKSRKKDEQEKKKKQRESKKAVDNAIKKIKNGNKKETQTENINPRILKLLGLEDYEAELDYEDYKRLLKEKMAADRMGGGKGEEEEGDNELLKNEFKRARTQSGSFKVQANKNKRKARTSNFVSKRPRQKPKPKSVKATKLLPSAGQTSSPENVKVEIQEDTQEQLLPLSKTLDDINSNLDKLLKIERQKIELEKQVAREAAKKEETEGFRKKEAKLEDTEKKSAEKVSKTLKPASNIFDSIINFFKNVLLGGAINLILDIIQNPGKYLKPLIDFGNFIIDFINNKIIKFINDIVFAPINAYIGLWNTAFNEIEWALKQLAKVLPGIPTPKLPRIPKVALPNIPNIQYPNWIQQQEGGGQVIDVKNLSLFDGGAIDKLTGLQIKGMGKDTQLIAAQPGEIMMSKKAVDMFGAGNLLAANAMAGGNNKPKFGKIQGFQGGGQVSLGGQGSAPIRDFGLGSGAGSKGYIVVPGHAAGAGAPGEMELVRDLARRTVENLKAKYGQSIPVRLLDMHDQTPNTDAGFIEQQNKLKTLEKQGYEVIEIHMDASLESGYGTGRGVIPPMPGTDAINPVEADFARTAGAFSKTHRGGLAGTNRGISLIELGNMSPLLQDLVLRGPGLSNQQLDALTKPLEESLSRGLNLQPGGTSPQQAQVSRQVVDVRISPPPSQGGGAAVLPVPVGQQGQVNSAASAAQKQIPGFSAEDSSNFDLIVVKSIYNIVG
jgi:chemotaxis protein histidine kinase CheA